MVILLIFQIAAYLASAIAGATTIEFDAPWWHFVIFGAALVLQHIAMVNTALRLRPTHYPPLNDHGGDVA